MTSPAHVQADGDAVTASRRTGILAVTAALVASSARTLHAVLLDQGLLLTPLLGEAARDGNHLHELAHDGRHLLAAPCH